jgi:CheY-like chemotaxis protein
MTRLVPRLPDDIRHDFNNAQTLIVYALARIAEEADVLAAGAPMTPAIDRLLEQAREGVDRVRSIVRDLKMFSRPDEEAATALDVWRVLESAINLTSSEIHHRARLTTDRGSVPAVLASEARLAQVFVNLLVNAAHAIPEGAAERNEIAVATRTDDAGRAIVEVRDTGVGIPPALVARLFDPFFTTKPVGQGTGLGLSICHGIVTALGGELTVESAPGRGSTFRVALPGTGGPTEPEPAPVAPTPAATAARRARILVIDDDPRIGDAVRESLASENDVVAVTNALAGLQLLERREHFDLILCDLMMLAMTGMDLHDELTRRDSSQAARMSFLTGGAFTPRAQAFLDEIPNPRLEKPFDPQGLRRFVRSLVANGS